MTQLHMHAIRRFIFRIQILGLFASALASTTPAQNYMYNQISLQTGSKPSGIAVADFNGDGRLDFAVPNANDNSVSVMIARADGTFAPKVDYPVGNAPMGLVAVDLNGDGKIDLAVVNSADNTVSILLGVGDGTFQTQRLVPAGMNPVAIAAGDYNGDGHVDLAVANQTDNSLSIFLGKGDATFTGPVSVPTNAAPFSVLSGDWNNDGKTDLVVLAGTGSSDSVSLLISKGDGTFSTTTLVTGESIGGMALADFNGDGYLDIALTNLFTNTVSILLGNGVTAPSGAQFDASNSFGAPPQSIVAGDFNGDGKIDIAVTETYFVAVYLGNGDGTFGTALNCGFPSFTAPPILAVADVNNDGLIDLAVLIPDYNIALVLLGNGDGTFANHTDFLLPGSGGIGGSVVADFTGDGKPDIATNQFNQPATGPIQGFISVLPNAGNGSFQKPISTTLADIGIGGMVSADFNGDGNLDLATADVNSNGGIAVFLATGSGTFDLPVDSFTGSTGLNVQPIVAGDFNRDGKADLIVVSEDDAATNSSPMYVLLSQGDGTFKQNFLYNLSYGMVPGIAVADFNHDGFLDLAVTTSGALLVFLGRGDGTFQPPTQFPIQSTFLNSVAAGDFNGDGNTDIVVGVSGGIWFFGGKGDGTFQKPKFTQNPLNMITLFAKDFNGDGILDLATQGPNLSDSILLGNGDGTFQQPSPFEPTYYPRSYTAGDLNADNVADLVQISTSDTLAEVPQTATVWFSTPTLAFGTPSLQFASQNVGTSSMPMPISMSNAGNAPFLLSSITAQGDFSQTNTCTNTLVIKDGCTIEVSFKPTANGRRIGSITIVGNGHPATRTLALSGWSGPPDFIPSVTLSSMTVVAGSTATYSLALASGGGFTGTVHLACMGAPAKASCTFTNGSPTLNANSTAKVQMSVTTTAPTLGALSPPSSQVGNISRGLLPIPVICLAVFLSFIALSLLMKRRLLTLTTVFALLIFTVSCGGGSGTPIGPPTIPGTPPGTYSLTLTATSGNLTHSTTVTLIVE
ncbi:MAG: FG-GAP-like repeat-containing protein [Candidatus Acidiferrales bacterium]